MTVVAVYELFQYDIVGLMHKLIIGPEKIIPTKLMSRFSKDEAKIMCLEVVKKSILILASLCEEN